jgi:hypothetical protein
MGRHIDDQGRFQSDKHALPPDRIRLSFLRAASQRALRVLAADYAGIDSELSASITVRLDALEAPPGPPTVEQVCSVIEAAADVVRPALEVLLSSLSSRRPVALREVVRGLVSLNSRERSPEEASTTERLLSRTLPGEPPVGRTYSRAILLRCRAANAASLSAAHREEAAHYARQAHAADPESVWGLSDPGMDLAANSRGLPDEWMYLAELRLPEPADDEPEVR